MKIVSRLKNDSSCESLNLQIAEPLTEKRSAEREEKLMNGKIHSEIEIGSELINSFRLSGAKRETQSSMKDFQFDCSTCH